MLIGIDVGGTRISGGLASDQGELQTRLCLSTDRSGGAIAGFNAIVQLVTDLEGLAARAGCRISRIGVGFGGPVDFDQGVVLLSHHVEGWEGFPLRSELERRLQTPVIVDNDAKAGTLAEWKFGAGRGLNDLLYINIGTGIGGGIISGGRLIRGKNNLAGEIGHSIIVGSGALCTCGKRGCLESCASGEAIARRGGEALGRPVTGRELFELARSGNEAALRVIAAVIEDLAHGIGFAVNLLNPAAVIIGGGLSEAPEDLFLEPLRAAVPSYCLGESSRQLLIEAALLRYDAGVMGAVALALS
jgi:glucokinase